MCGLVLHPTRSNWLVFLGLVHPRAGTLPSPMKNHGFNGGRPVEIGDEQVISCHDLLGPCQFNAEFDGFWSTLFSDKTQTN